MNQTVDWLLSSQETCDNFAFNCVVAKLTTNQINNMQYTPNLDVYSYMDISRFASKNYLWFLVRLHTYIRSQSCIYQLWP
jgi:hypothetical protein